jgi:hypothetical protein
MVEQRSLLPEDAQRIIEEAKKLPLFDVKKPYAHR